MFDIGFGELLIIALLTLVVVGPERLPRVMRSGQRMVARIKQFSSRMEAELNHELRVKELHENLKKIESYDNVDDLPDDLKNSLQELQRAAESVRAPYASSNAVKDKGDEQHQQNPDSKE